MSCNRGLQRKQVVTDWYSGFGGAWTDCSFWWNAIVFWSSSGFVVLDSVCLCCIMFVSGLNSGSDCLEGSTLCLSR